MTTQGSLNVTQKEDIVNKRTPNFALSERNIEFTENQQEFILKNVFHNTREWSPDEGGASILSESSFEKEYSENKKLIVKLIIDGVSPSEIGRSRLVEIPVFFLL